MASTSQKPISLSVLIRCRNQAQTLQQVLHALSLQEFSQPYELVVVDNASSDDTCAVARQYGAKIVEISKEEYTDGRALNRGMAVTCGELVLILSAHSLPLGRHFLQYAVAPFVDPQMAAAMCILSDRKAFTSKWYDPEDIFWPQNARPATRQDMLTGVRKFMNSGVVVRRAVWEQIPYDETLEFMEDKQWAIAALSAGYKIRRCSEAVYVYMLSRDHNAALQRALRTASAAYRMTGVPPLDREQFIKRIALAFIEAIRQAYRHISSEIYLSRKLLMISRHSTPPSQVGSRDENDAHR